MKIQLEPATFRIPVTTDWKTCENKEWREAPTKDIWVHENGEQLYAWAAALRETKKAGKRLPTDEELEGMELEDFSGLLAGYRVMNGTFYNRGTYTFVWSSSEAGGNVWGRALHSSFPTVNRRTYTKDYGFSVRCLLEE